MIRIDGLNQHDSGRLAASGAAGGLRQELEGSLGGAEIGEAQADVGVHDAHQRDVGNVVTLGDHLRADQDVVIALAEAGQDGFVVALAADGIAVQPRDAGFRKRAVQLVFERAPSRRRGTGYSRYRTWGSAPGRARSSCSSGTACGGRAR